MEKSEKEMRELERSRDFVATKKAIIERDHLLNYAEWEMWSKRAHGDIYALVQMSVNLRGRDSDIRGAILREVPFGIMANVLITRAIGFSIVLLKHVIEEFRIAAAMPSLVAAAKEYGEIQARDRAARQTSPASSQRSG